MIKKMQCLLFTLLATATLASLGLSTAALAAQPLKIGISAEPYPPFTYKSSNGNWTGFEIDLADAVCAELDQECEHVPTSWSGIILALKSGKIDMIMGSMSINEKRARQVSFSKPYYKTGLAFVTRKNEDIDIPDGLQGKIIGVQSATHAAQYVRKHFSDSGARIKFYPKQDQINRDLMSYRIDLQVADSVAMLPFVKNNKSDVKLIKTTPPYGEGVGVALRKSDTKLLKKVNKALTAVIESGECTKLSEQYFDKDICAKR